MPNNNLTDAEIIKALECCGQNVLFEHCVDCPFNDLSKAICTIRLSRVALDLINRQKAELEKNENIIRLADKAIETANAEIERLKTTQFQFISDINAYKEKLKTAKAEAYKECIEKVKQRAECCSCSDAVNTIADNVLKDLEGEQNCE